VNAPGHLTDIPGVRVGHADRRRAGWRTGTTVVLLPDGSVGGVDIRGGAPGTRETDLLHPENLVDRIDAVCLTGGSAFGLAAADGVMQWLADHRQGVRVGEPEHWVVPIVPAAVIFDLGRGGRFEARPDADFGRRAATAARHRPEAQGSVGAGTGARAGGLQGGVGSASRMVGSHRIAALAVVNAAGSVIDPGTGLPHERWTWPVLNVSRPDAAARRRLAAIVSTPPPSALNTTIGVVVTTAQLDKAGARRVAMSAHDGLARAIRPAHLLRDGDTVFCAATGSSGSIDDLTARDELLAAAADVFALACTRAVVCAQGHPGGPPAWKDLTAHPGPAA
jgi:L-aminopeptidase/D-esterase-like protein